LGSGCLEQPAHTICHDGRLSFVLFHTFATVQAVCSSWVGAAWERGGKQEEWCGRPPTPAPPVTRPPLAGTVGPQRIASKGRAGLRYNSPASNYLVKSRTHCCPKELQKTTKPQGSTFYLFIPFSGSISATICVICGKSHDPQMTQIYADGKQGTDIRARRFRTQIRMSERPKIRLIGNTSSSSRRKGVPRTLSRKNVVYLLKMAFCKPPFGQKCVVHVRFTAALPCGGYKRNAYSANT